MKLDQIEECPICKEDINYEDLLFSNCNHYFHKKCLYKSIRGKTLKKCPICRQLLILEKIEKKKVQFNDIYEYPQLKMALKTFDLMNGQNKLIDKKWFISGGFAYYLYRYIYYAECIDFDDINIYTFTNNIYTNNIKTQIFKEKEKDEMDYEEFLNYDSYSTTSEKTQEPLQQIQTQHQQFVMNNNLFQQYQEIDWQQCQLNQFKNNNLVLNEKATKIKKQKYSIVRLTDDLYNKHEGKFKNIIYQVLDTFDLSCNKIAIFIQNKQDVCTFKFYFHPDFWCDIYQIKHQNTMERIAKYETRDVQLDEFN